MTPGTIGLQNPLRDPQMDRPARECDRCRGELYSGETVYNWDGKEICPDCFEEVVTDWVRKAPSEVASALRISTRQLMEGD